MARREIVSYEVVDDDDGRPGAVPVIVGIGDEVFEADLHPTRLADLQGLLSLLRSCGRPFRGESKPEPAPPPASTPAPACNHFRPAPDAKAVRTWAKKHKIPVKDTGRIDGRITEAYVRCVIDQNPNYLEELLRHPDFLQGETGLS